MGNYPFYPSAVTAAGIYSLNSYGADPTGAAFSDTAMAAAQAAIGNGAGIITAAPGTYKFADSYSFGPGQGIATQLPNGAITFEYTGNGVFMYSGDPDFNTGTTSPDVSLCGPMTGFTIDGTGAGADASGLQAGDQNNPDINVCIQNFTGASATGLLLSNNTGWCNGGNITASIANCTTLIAYANSGGSGTYGAVNFTFTVLSEPDQNVVTWQDNCIIGAGVFTLNGSCLGGETNTGAVLNFTEGGLLESFFILNIECDEGTGTTGPVTIAMPGNNSGFIEGCNGIMVFHNDVAAFQASTGVAYLTFAGFVSSDTADPVLGSNVPGDLFGLSILGGILESGTETTYAGDGIIYNGGGSYFATTLASGANTYALYALIPGRAQHLTWLVTQPASGSAGTLTLTGAKTVTGSGVLTLSSTNGYTDVIDIFTPDGVNVYATVLGLHYH